jgi:hypothetical protein
LLLEVKGSHACWIEKLGISADSNGHKLTLAQLKLRQIATLQNFCRVNPERPQWAKGAFVYVTVEDAAEIQQAVKECEMELKKHHVLVSPSYVDVVLDALACRPAERGRQAYVMGRSGSAKPIMVVQPSTFSPSERVRSGMGPCSIDSEDVIVRHTFLHVPLEGSDLSRQTRSTGDRLLPKRGQDAGGLPGPFANYGPQRKRFELTIPSIMAQSSADRAEIQDDFFSASDNTSDGTGYFSLDSMGQESPSLYHLDILERIYEPAPPCEDRSGLTKLIIKAFKDAMLKTFVQAPPPANDVSAASAIEATCARKVAIQSVRTNFEQRVLANLATLADLQEIDFFPKHIWLSVLRGIIPGLRKRFARDRNTVVMKAVEMDEMDEVKFLRSSVLDEMDEVLLQQLQSKFAAISRKHGKTTRLLTIPESRESSESDGPYVVGRRKQRMERIARMEDARRTRRKERKHGW